MKLLPLVGAIIAGASIVSGCSDNDSAPATGFTPHVRVAPLAAQTATISIADPAGTPVVTVTSQPADIELSGTATAVSGTNTTLSLSATNNATRLLFGAKVVVNTVSDATGGNAVTWFATGTTNDTSEEFASLGVKAIDMGGSATVDDIDLTDLDGLDDPLVITVTLPTEEVVAYGGTDTTAGEDYEIQDVNGSLEIVDTEVATFANLTPGSGGLVDGVTSQDGRHIYYAGRNSVEVIVLDTVTLQTTGIRLTDKNQGNVGGIEMTSDGRYLYAPFVTGGHRYCYSYGAENTAHVAKIDLSNNEVVQVLDVAITASSYYQTSFKDIALSGDEGTIAITTGTSCSSEEGGSMFIISTDDGEGNMAVTDHFATTDASPRYVALNDDASTAYYVSRDNENWVHVLDVATGERSHIVLTDTNTSSPVFLDFGPDGRLYYMRQTTTGALAIFDFSVSDTDTVIDVTGTAAGMSFDLDGDKYYINEGSGTSTWDITTDTETTAASGASNIARHSYVTSAY